MTTPLWITPTTDSVISEFATEETKYIQEHGVEGSLDGILQRAVNIFRGAVIAGGGIVGQPGTIAAELEADVVAYAKWTWMASNPLLSSFKSEDRRALFQMALDTLQGIRSGKIAVTLPTTEETLETRALVNSIEVVRSQPRQADWCELRDIV